MLVGIGHAVAGVFLFGMMNALIKWLGDSYSVVQVLFFRQVFALIPVAIMVQRAGGPAVLRPVNLRGQITRALVGTAAAFMTFWALTLLPLANAVAIMFAAPLFITALSVPILKETVGPHRWGAVLVGFVGVLIVTNPTGDFWQLGALVALAAAGLQGFAMVTIRELSRTDPPVTIVFWFTAVCALAAGLALPFVWQTPDLEGWALLLALGLLGGLAQICMTEGFRNAPAALVGPFNYSAILWASLFGFLIWAEVPGWNVAAGTALVVLSGLYIIRRETLKKRASRRLP